MNKAFLIFCACFIGFSLPVKSQEIETPSLDTIIEQQTNNLDEIVVDGEVDEVAPEQTEDITEFDESALINPNFLLEDVKAYDNYKKVSVRILDKITADTKTFDLEIGKTVAYGAVRIRPMACKKSPPIEQPESASFLQIWEKIPEGSDKWVFSGWMFASSPSLSTMEHPVYDVWIIDCKD